jgi:hypothetical protein
MTRFVTTGFVNRGTAAIAVLAGVVTREYRSFLA